MALLLKVKQIQNRLGPVAKSLSSHLSNSSSKKGLVLGVYYDEESKCLELTPDAKEFNSIIDDKLLDHIKLAGNEVKQGKSLIFWGLHEEFPAVGLVGLGKKRKENDDLELIDSEKEAVRIAASAGCRALDNVGIKNICMESLQDPEAAAEGSILGAWKYQEFKTKKETIPKVGLFSDNSDDEALWNQGAIKAYAQNTARRLSDTPANYMTPTIFANEACNLLNLPNVDVKVHDKEWAEKQKMGAFLSVARGSVEPPKFLEITYDSGDSDENPIVLVGKGVCFDAGGVSLKPAANMDLMRADMTGAAVVVGTMYAIAKLKLKTHVKALIPLVENLPSGSATKPGDVVKARNGKTICVDNTDAEGRLILADALCYSEIFKPKWVLDIATLTGAMSVAIGNATTGVFSNSNDLYNCLQTAGSCTGDRVWRFPLWKHYTKQLTDNPAYDLNNIGKGKGGGCCTAAAFLREFVCKNTPWLHLDIAGVLGPNDPTPYLSGKTLPGRPTRTLIEFIRLQSN